MAESTNQSTSRRRRTTRLTALLATLVLGHGAAQASGGVLVLRTSDLAPYKSTEEGFAAALGRPIKSLTLGSGDVDAALRSASLVFAIGPEAAKTVASAKLSTPVLYALVPDPARVGLDAATLRVKGVPMFVPPIRQASLIRTALPGAKSVGVIFDPSLSRELIAGCEAAATQAGLKLVKEEVSSRKDVAAGVRRLMGKVDAIWLVPDATVIAADTFKFMVQTSLENRVPLIGFSRAMTRAGALLSVEAEYPEMGRRAAAAARRLLAGAPASPEPVEGSLSINARTAGLVGVSLPAPLKAKAAEVFE